MIRISIKRCLLLLFFAMGGYQLTLAQEINDPDLEMEEFMNLMLPSLDVLFENAKNGPTYEFGEVQEQIERKLLQKEKRAFLSFFSIRGSYQYGNYANDYSFSDVVTPIMYSYNSAEQNSYTIGAAVNIPLDQLFDLGSRIKRQKLNVRAAKLLKEEKHELLKKEIIQLYALATSQLNGLKLRSQAVILANAQYAIIERNFTNGTVTSAELANEKDNQSMTIQRFEDSKFELNRSLLILEVITHTQIFKK